MGPGASGSDCKKWIDPVAAMAPSSNWTTCLKEDQGTDSQRSLSDGDWSIWKWLQEVDRSYAAPDSAWTLDH